MALKYLSIPCFLDVLRVFDDVSLRKLLNVEMGLGN